MHISTGMQVLSVELFFFIASKYMLSPKNMTWVTELAFPTDE